MDFFHRGYVGSGTSNYPMRFDTKKTWVEKKVLNLEFLGWSPRKSHLEESNDHLLGHFPTANKELVFWCRWKILCKNTRTILLDVFFVGVFCGLDPMGFITIKSTTIGRRKSLGQSQASKIKANPSFLLHKTSQNYIPKKPWDFPRSFHQRSPFKFP